MHAPSAIPVVTLVGVPTHGYDGYRAWVSVPVAALEVKMAKAVPTELHRPV